MSLFCPDWTRFPRLLDQGLSKREVAARAANRNSIDLMIEAKRIKPGRVAQLSALYFMVPEGIDEICKIGIAEDPWLRLTGLQTGCWAKLRIAALFWYPRIADAAAHEFLALRLAKKEKVKLEGEWVALEPDEAIGLTLTAVKDSDRQQFTDSHGVVFEWFIECARQKNAEEDAFYAQLSAETEAMKRNLEKLKAA